MFFNFVWPPNLANIPPYYVVLIQTIDGSCIFSISLAKLANMVQDKKLTNIPPQPWGAIDKMHFKHYACTLPTA